MIKSYFKIILRNLLKHKLYMGINIFGLAIGLSLSLMVLGHLSHELSFEDCHKNRDRIYRVNGYHQTENDLDYSARVVSPLAAALKAEMPEVEQAAVFRVFGDIDLSLGENKFVNRRSQAGYEYSGNLFVANTDFLKTFTVPLIVGDIETVLEEPYSILITRETVEKYFNGVYPIGQVIKLNDSIECQVTGIMENIPNNTQIHCEFLLSYSTLERMGYDNLKWTDYGSDYVYLLMKEGVQLSNLSNKILEIFKRNVEYEAPEKYWFELEQLEHIYFNTYGSGRYRNLYPAGESSLIWTIAIVATFILLLAISNFINLATARSAERMKEVGVRKVFGANRNNLIRQFMGEAFFITLVSIILGLAIYEIFKIQSAGWFPRQFFADFYNNPIMVGFIFLLLFVVSIGTGYYPALHLSRFKPVTVLQNRTGFHSKKSILRRVLVVFQFSIAIIFICSTAIVYEQIMFLKGLDLGFDNANMLVLEFKGENASDDCLKMKDEVLRKNNVLAASALNTPPGVRNFSSYRYYKNEDMDDSNSIIAKNIFVDHDFLETFKLELVQGRSFSDFSESELKDLMIITEQTAESLGVAGNAIGYKFYHSQGEFKVVGVVKDFFATTLDFAYKPYTTIRYRPESYEYLVVKLPQEDISQNIAAIKQTWDATFPGVTFDYKFLDEAIDISYGDRDSSGQMLFVLSILAISIACLGMLGLVSFTAERKSKEIGIRKVLGASVNNIVSLLAKEFVVLIIISNIIAWPLSYLMMQSYLTEFALQVDISIMTYLYTGVIAVVLALLTSSFQSVKAAIANPVDAIKYE